jgi:hypothetical protein
MEEEANIIRLLKIVGLAKREQEGGEEYGE